MQPTPQNQHPQIAPQLRAPSLELATSRAQLLNDRCSGIGGRGGNPTEFRQSDRRKLGKSFFSGALGGRGAALRPKAESDLLGPLGFGGFCACPGHAAPGNGTASAVRIARAAEIALRLDEPRMRGVGGDLPATLPSEEAVEGVEGGDATASTPSIISASVRGAVGDRLS